MTFMAKQNKGKHYNKETPDKQSEEKERRQKKGSKGDGKKGSSRPKEGVVESYLDQVTHLIYNLPASLRPKRSWERKKLRYDQDGSSFLAEAQLHGSLAATVQS